MHLQSKAEKKLTEDKEKQIKPRKQRKHDMPNPNHNRISEIAVHEASKTKEFSSEKHESCE